MGKAFEVSRLIPRYHVKGALILALSRAKSFSLQQFITVLQYGEIQYCINTNIDTLTDATNRLISIIYLRDTEGKAKRTLGDGWPNRLKLAFLLEACAALKFITLVEDTDVKKDAYFYERSKEYYTTGRLIPTGLIRLIDAFSMSDEGFQVPGTGYRFLPGVTLNKGVYNAIVSHTKQISKFNEQDWKRVSDANYFSPEHSGLFTKIKRVLIPDFDIQQPTFLDGQVQTWAIGDLICRSEDDVTSSKYQLLRSSGITDLSMAVNIALNVSLTTKTSAGLNLINLIYSPVSENVDPMIDRLITWYWFGIEYDGGQLRPSNGGLDDVPDLEQLN